MIHLLLPYALRGTIWYQGEGNAGGHVGYARAFPALISSWRNLFAQGDFPFTGFSFPAMETTNGTAA